MTQIQNRPDSSAPGDHRGYRRSRNATDIRSPISRFRSAGRHLAALGPFALVFAIYNIALDHLPDDWFKVDPVRYAFAVLLALTAGVLMRWGFQRPRLQRMLGTPSEVGMLLPGPRSPSSLVSSAEAVFAGTRAKLLADLREGSRNGTDLLGWSQYFADRVSMAGGGATDRVPPSAIGTSYGLRIAQALDVRDARLDRGRIVDSILVLQRPNGGWTARSQRDTARPEVMSWVLSAAFRAGLGAASRKELVEKLAALMSPEVDPVAMNSVTVLTSVINTLAEVAPENQKLEELIGMLVSSAVDVGGPTTSRGEVWGRILQPAKEISVVHTARAVVALRRAEIAGAGRDHSLNEVIEESVEWLAQHADLETTDEQIRRMDPDGDTTEILLVGHFTSAWVARALMCSKRDLQLTALRQSVRAVLAHQENGVWRWKNQLEPTWMTYQGIVALRDYSTLNLPWPP